MKKVSQYVVPPNVAFDDDNFKTFVLRKEKLQNEKDVTVRMTRRSVDARKQKVKVNVQAEIFVNEKPSLSISYKKDYQEVSNSKRVIIVGAGPAGLFAALRFLELGIKPIIIERGNDVQKRRRDLANINKKNIVNEDSNYCFGEGGAGTYSDGKLYTRSKKRGDFRRICEIFVAHSASEEILIDAHPHIGTNKLPKVIAEMRESVLNAGGEVHFETRVTDFILNKDEIKGVVTQNGDKFEGEAVLLATGHSARDIFRLLHQKEIQIERKPFALGVRIEHPQGLIDKVQYHLQDRDRGEFLPAAAYSLVSQVGYKGQKKGVFSFCMCPGGFIVPSATAPGEVVVNGMSPSRRDSKFSNSGIVVSVDDDEFAPYIEKYGELAAMEFQAAIEKQACVVAGGTQVAPAQRLVDFVQGKVSQELNETSYQPGLLSVDMREVLPEALAHRLKFGFKDFGKKMKGYLTNEAQIVGVESRTSSPVRIPREKETCEHTQLKRLFPSGEGAGYAGGIASAAMDGELCANRIAEMYCGVKDAASK
ncbi:FAD-binding protein [Flammeovirga sp. MY04]|uniref:NAD(P)/FAD-dependent oxidoreductase n=1 Tax=Flammeovirga sp. MY04 TaxID=1191459 RepID=UPI0008061575|nr:NAD(P)/FAD-dependent oxidoreductase [Flammeovirga sp. MY04]ANQ47624.1 FAD-binding protein [Flammeovirga sp. MY04]